MSSIELVIINLEQGSSEWLEWRDGGVGSSDVPVVTGECEEKTIYRLYLEKTHQIEPIDFSKNPHVKRGKRCEPFVRDIVSNHFGISFESFCAEDRNNPHRKVSFDGVALMALDGYLKSAIPAEIKCPCQSVFDDISNLGIESKSYNRYLPQLLYQMEMLGSPFGYLVFFNENTSETMIFKVLKDAKRQADILKQLDTFYFENIVKGVEPEMDKERDVFVLTESNRDKWHLYAAQMNSLKQREKELSDEIKSLKLKMDAISADLINMTDGFKSVRADNIMVTRVKRKDSFDYKSFVTDLGIQITDADREKYSKKSSLSYRVTLYDKDEIQQRDLTKFSKIICNSHDLRAAVAAAI